jgi:hypothetical protein
MLAKKHQLQTWLYIVISLAAVSGRRVLRRAVEIWLFRYTPYPSRAVTELLAKENRD